MAVLTRMEKMLFPCFLFVFEVVFLVLYGVLVRYDELSSPLPARGNETTAHAAAEEGQFSEAAASVVSTYPREF